MAHKGGHGFPKTKQIKYELRKIADEAKAEYDKLSLEEKLKRLPAGGAKRQRARLLALIELSARKKSTPTPVVAVASTDTLSSTESSTKKLSKKERDRMRNGE